MFSQFEEDAQKVMLDAKVEKEKLRHPYIGSEHLLLAILSHKDLDLTKQLKKYDITYDIFYKEIIDSIGMGSKTNKWFLYTPLLKRILEGAIYDSHDNNEDKVSVLRLFLSLLEEGDGVAIRILMVMNIDVEALYDVFAVKIKKKTRKSNKLLIEEYGINLTEKAKAGEIDPVSSRDEEIIRLQEILIRKTKNNPVLIGEAGVGKTAIVEGLALKISEGKAINKLENTRIYSVSMASLVAGTKYRGEFEERINKLIKELESVDNVIVFIDEVHTLVGAGGAEGAIDASNILKPALARNKIKIIGATTNNEYNKFIAQDAALNRRFQKIEVNEPDFNKTKEILKNLKSTYEKYHHISISDDKLDMVIKLSNEYINDRKQPDKAIDILDEACTKKIVIGNREDGKKTRYRERLREILEDKNKAIKNGDFEKASSLRKKEQQLENSLNKLELYNSPKELDEETIIRVVEDKAKVLINKHYSKEGLNKIAREMKKVIIGQDIIIDELIRETKLNSYKKNRVHSYLLTGTTGVGKTSLINIYKDKFYDEALRLNMEEYKDTSSLTKLLGSPPGYVGYDHDCVFEKVRKHPRMLIIMENIDKAATVIKKVVKEIMEKGKIENNKGEEIDFNNCTILMTATIDTRGLGFVDDGKETIINKYFSKEFLSKIDKVFMFEKLTNKGIKMIIENKLTEMRKYYLEKGIALSFNRKIIDEIVSESDYVKYGASRTDMIIDSKFSEIIIDRILAGEKEIMIG